MKLMQFLMGLDDSYMKIRSSILSREVLPNVRSAYATISSEESHIVASGSIAGSSQRNQASAFMSNVPNRGVVQRGQSSSTAPRTNNFSYNRQGGGYGFVYENCGFNGYTIDRCFKIIGYPADFGKKKSRQNYKGKNVSNNVVGSGSSSGFTDEQMTTLISLKKDNINGKNEVLRPMGKDKGRDATKMKGSRSSRASRSPSKNKETLARLMETEMTAREKEQRDTILEIKKREVECRERELANEEYRQHQ
ncbi:hypothetical protein Tco_1028498 [Tanacetum coccineum]|uniref:Uncharacterized protein n=1 Tax=Tanacetum coccineum TaxID=301880 RepID=A0ABQ5G0U9_9ASTR